MKSQETELLYSTLFEQSPYGITIIDHKTRKIIEFNNAACAQLGYTRDEFYGMQVSDFEAAETPEETKRHIAKIEHQGGDEFDTKYRTRNGEIRDYHILAKVIELHGKKVLLSIHHDITEHLIAEQALKENEERYRSLVELSPDAIFIQSEGKIVFMNSAGAKLLGADSPEQLLGKSVISLVHPDYREIVAERISKAVEKGTIMPTLEEKYLRLDGTAIDVEVKSIAFIYQGKPAMQVVVRDISERKRTEEDLKLSAQLLDSATDAIFLHDLDGNVIYSNEKAYSPFGYSKEEFMKMNVHQLVAKGYKLKGRLLRELKEKGNVIFEDTVLHKNRATSPMEVNASLVELKGQTLVLSVSRDITERKKAEEELKLSDQLLDSTTDAIVLHDIDGNFVFVNETTCKSFGYTREELLRMKMPQLNPPEQAKNFESSMQDLIEKGSSKVELTILHKNGTAIPMETYGRVVEHGGRKLILGVLRDITERKKVEEELKLRAQLIDNATDCIFLHGFEQNFIYVNETMCKTHGYSREEFMNMQLSDIISTEHAEFLKKRYQQLHDEGYDTFESKHFHKDGSIIPLEIHSRIIELEDRRLILTVARDITERKTAEEELKLRAQLLDNATDFIFLRDLDGNYAYVNESALKALGYSQEEFMKLKVNKAVASGYTWVKGSLMEELKEKDTVTFETALKCKDGSTIPVESHACLIKSSGKKFILSTVRNITERKKFEEAIKQLAYHDPLTGLPNRTLFNDRVTLALAHATRYDGRFALLMMDLDKFKEVNDTLGHDIGDELLKGVSRRLKSAIRKVDTVSRMGGDEFVLLISELTNEEDAANVAQKILKSINQPFVLDKNEINITTSIGIAVYPEDGKDIDDLIKHADFAMYTIKRGGRNGYMRYTPDMDSKASRSRPSATLNPKPKT